MQADVSAHQRIQEDAYTSEFLETPEAFLARVNCFPDGCWMAEELAAGTPVAYLLSHPWRISMPPPVLNLSNFRLPTPCDCFYIHSLTIMKPFQRCGLGRVMAELALAHGVRLGLRSASLISVQHSESFWERLGFRSLSPAPPEIMEGLSCYGSDARFMVRPA